MSDDPPIQSRASWSELELMEPQTINEARLQMCAQLHRALYGDVWARPQTPESVWFEMLDRIARAARALQR